MSLLNRFQVDGRVAVITGAGRGIGAACALALAEGGADVAITARTASQLEEVAAQVEALGRRALVFPADVNELAALGAFVEATMTKFGRIDIVVNNAGGTFPTPFVDTTSEFLEQAFHFNVTTAFELTRLCVPHMLTSVDAHGGTGAVVNVSSIMGRISERGFVAYSTVKAALAHMTRAMAIDLAPRIRVNAMALGSFATSALDMVLQSPALRDEMEAKTPLKRIGDPSEVGLLALYLASSAGEYFTGKVLEIDGGLEAASLDMRIPDL